tara:strand:- start:199 stop:600 length:402 start_codon:yes stop_codon:yes gene_type:complete
MNAKDLELKISGLEKAIEEHKADASRYEDELKQTTKKLEDINKPEITPLQFDLIQEAIETGVDNFAFDDDANYDKEFGINYEGKVYLESLDLTCTYELVEMITKQVHKLFTEAECPEDDDSQLNTQTVAEKVI